MIKKLLQIKYAETTLPESMIFNGGSAENKIPIIFSFYYIETDKRKLLVDVGCDTMPGFDMNNHILPDEALGKYGISADEITDVIITHSHHDHIDGLRHFKNAEVYIQCDEYEDGKIYIPRGQCVTVFDETVFPDKDIKVRKIGGHSRGSCVAELVFNGEACVIVGDECYTEYNICNRVPTATSFNPEKSRCFIEKYATGEYKTFLMHK